MPSKCFLFSFLFLTVLSRSDGAVLISGNVETLKVLKEEK